MAEHYGERSQHKYTNRLINETSPYLLQHAHNPVDWYAWSEEAFQKARTEDRPILLSIGYSACHWCHVMEHESFENEEIAALMNRHFVCIKVDREERPDLDSIYMQAVQAMTHQGGWPMTVFLTPDGRPFYGGTYYPPDDRQYGQHIMPGFRRILLSVAQAFATRRTEVEEQAGQVADFLRQGSAAPLRARVASKATGSLPLDILKSAAQKLAADFDSSNGGFGGAPKFPHPMELELLLRLHLHQQRGEISADSQPGEYLKMVELSLQHMANGGIYDQLGGGFHRYAVDNHWLVPHFEKMLYDNALLSRIYLHAYLVTGNALYRRIVEETLDYVLREMTAPQGGFYSTQDADSEGEEGKFFLWTYETIEQALPAQDASLFLRYYGVTQRGNFEGKNILHVARSAQEIADEAGVSLEHLQDSLQRSRATLFRLREQRVKPGRDEKILTAWNGLMLRSFAEAARYLDRRDYLRAAINNASFLLRALRKEGRLMRSYKDEHAHLRGYLEDYAFLADGLLALYESTFDPRWFAEARALMNQAIELFADEQNGGFFDTGSDHEALITRPKDIMDNATPAGNSVAADVLLHLTAFTGETTYRRRAEDYLQSLADIALQHPQAFGHMLNALDFALSASKEIAVVGPLDDAATDSLLEEVNRRYLPDSVLAAADPDDVQAARIVPLLAGRPLKDGRPAAYVCQNFACQAPVTTVSDLARLL
ncbi:MAG: thioredoxin domain-containing protein [Ktedonobacteraceae bacterium]|nr:thioredoxin domain-containing protein [Ktedonobacteraceae bacterium]